MHGALRSMESVKILSERPRSLLRFFTCGSVDDGKSTLIGRMLYDTNSVFEDQLQSLKRDSIKFGTQGTGIDFALLLDGLSAEREQGITIDVAYRYFNTDRRSFIVADTPGHEQYTRNMATGASTAELAIILIDARKGILPQTLRHTFIVSMLGVQDVVVAVNKMDLVSFDEKVFNEIVKSFGEISRKLGLSNVVSVPLSARDGDNMLTISDRTPWYHGPSLISHLETVEPIAASLHGSFAMPVQWVNRPNLDFRGYAGTITSGEVSVGDEILILPGARRTQIARIIGPDGGVECAVAGEAITLTLTDEIDISRGTVLASQSHHLRPSRNFHAQLLWMVDEPLALQREYAIQTASGMANGRVSELFHQIDVENFQHRPIEKLAINQIGIVSLTCDKTIIVANYIQDREFGSFILIDKLNNQTVALGLVKPNGLNANRSSSEQPIGKALWQRRILRFKAAEVIWSVAPTCAVATLVFAISGSSLATLVVLTGDLFLRPMTSFIRRQARSGPSNSGGDTFEDGAGM